MICTNQTAGLMHKIVNSNDLRPHSTNTIQIAVRTRDSLSHKRTTASPNRASLEGQGPIDDHAVKIPRIFSSGNCCAVRSSSLHRSILENHRRIAEAVRSEDLNFRPPAGTLLDAQNLYNPEFAPACDRIGQPRISVTLVPAHPRNPPEPDRRVSPKPPVPCSGTRTWRRRLLYKSSLTRIDAACDCLLSR
jgi:hypothetical protein